MFGLIPNSEQQAKRNNLDPDFTTAALLISAWKADLYILPCEMLHSERLSPPTD